MPLGQVSPHSSTSLSSMSGHLRQPSVDAPESLYRVVANYNQQNPGEVTLPLGGAVDVLEKDLSGEACGAKTLSLFMINTTESFKMIFKINCWCGVLSHKNKNRPIYFQPYRPGPNKKYQAGHGRHNASKNCVNCIRHGVLSSK